MATPLEFDGRMSESDALIWNIERDPQLRSTVVGVWLLDGAPDLPRFERKIERASLEVPRLRQRAVPDPLGLAPPSWETDPHFDLSFHVRRVAAPGSGSFRDLLDLAQPIGMQAFDRERPLWELHLVDGLEGGRFGLILKLHHAVSDGVGLVRMTRSLIERSPEAEERAPERLPLPALAEPLGDFDRSLLALAHRARADAARGGQLAAAARSAAGRMLRDPAGALRGAGEALGSLSRLLAPVSEPLSPIMTGRSLSAHYDTLSAPLDELKRAARCVDGTVNDAFVAAVAGGFQRYHAHFGASPTTLRMNMPINVRAGEKGRKMGNQFVPVRFEVPVGITDPAERMRGIGAAVRAQRNEPALPWQEEVSGAIGRLPAGLSARVLGSLVKAVDFTTSNVPGPRFPVYASGARVEQMMGFGPLCGAAANITCFSYDGWLAIGVNSDPAAVEDPALLADCLHKGLDEVLSVL